MLVQWAKANTTISKTSVVMLNANQLTTHIVVKRLIIARLVWETTRLVVCSVRIVAAADDNNSGNGFVSESWLSSENMAKLWLTLHDYFTVIKFSRVYSIRQCLIFVCTTPTIICKPKKSLFKLQNFIDVFINSSENI